MNRSFSLAGLLRVRGVQERAAAQRLSRAAIDAEQTRARDRQLRAALAASASDAVDVRTLSALAAARVAARSALADLDALKQAQEQEVDAAATAHVAARREVRGLERLAAAHRRFTLAEALRIEQEELDEIGLRRRKEPRS